MRNPVLCSALLFGCIAVGSLLARNNGWYGAYWYTDVILHILSGLALGLLWIAVLRKTTFSFFLLFISTMSFAVFGSFLWELWEFAGWRITPSHTQFYMPELGDTLLDIVCGACGGVLAAVTSINQSE